jgi:hypothetical protein
MGTCSFFQDLPNNTICNCIVILIIIAAISRSRNTPSQRGRQRSNGVDDADIGMRSQTANVIPAVGERESRDFCTRRTNHNHGARLLINGESVAKMLTL